MKITKVKINQLKSAEYNPRKWNETELKNLQKSIDKFGIVDPLIVNSAKNRFNIVIGGHMRLKVCRDIGFREMPCVYIDIPEIENEKELNLRLNANTGSWDYELLNTFDKLLLTDIGLDLELIELNLPKILPDEKDDMVPPIQKKTNIKIGDMFQLGKHRLLCGDCTIKENVEKLMDGRKAEIISIIDPPYGINVVKGKKHTVGGGETHFKGKIGGRKIVEANSYFNIIGDETTQTAKKIYQVLNELDIKRIITWGGNYFTDFLPPSPCWIVWDKREGIPSNNFADCEIAWTNFNSPARIYRQLWSGLLRKGDRKTEGTKRMHPTQKPVGLLIDIIKDFAEPNDIILDTFLGSGSTLIACEKTGRICYGMELEPLYCQVIIDHWQEYTGKKVAKL